MKITATLLLPTTLGAPIEGGGEALFAARGGSPRFELEELTSEDLTVAVPPPSGTEDEASEDVMPPLGLPKNTVLSGDRIPPAELVSLHPEYAPDLLISSSEHTVPPNPEPGPETPAPPLPALRATVVSEPQIDLAPPIDTQVEVPERTAALQDPGEIRLPTLEEPPRATQSVATLPMNRGADAEKAVAWRPPPDMPDAPTTARTVAAVDTVKPAQQPQVSVVEQGERQTFEQLTPSTTRSEIGPGLAMVPSITTQPAPIGPQATAPPPPALAQTLVELISSGKSGTAEIRLDPPELGRVSLHVVVEGDAITAVIAAERAETTELVRRWGDQLHRLLADAGFSQTSLEFAEHRNREEHRPDAAPSPELTEVTHIHSVATSNLDLRL